MEDLVVNEISIFFHHIKERPVCCKGAVRHLDQRISWLRCTETEVSNCFSATLIRNALMYVCVCVCLCVCIKHFSHYLVATHNILKIDYPNCNFTLWYVTGSNPYHYITVTDMLLCKMEMNTKATFWNVDVSWGRVFGVSIRECWAREQWQG